MLDYTPPPDSTPLAQIFAKMRALVTAIDGRDRFGIGTVNITAVNVTTPPQDIFFVPPFPAGVTPVVVLSGNTGSAQANRTVALQPGSESATGFQVVGLNKNSTAAIAFSWIARA